MNRIVNSSKQTQTKPSVGAMVGGVLVGNMVAGAATIPHKLVAPKIMEKMTKMSGDLSADKITLVKDAAEKALKNNGLNKKGVEIIRATRENSDEITKIMAKEFDGNLLTKFLPKQVKELLASQQEFAVSNGMNAFFATKSNKIVMPEKDMVLSVFHEIGHAANKNISKFTKVLQKCRGFSALLLPIALIALLKNKKQEDQEPTGAVDKATTFIKKNAGKLTFAAFLPMLLEEGLATIKGNGMAKKLLNPNLVKKVAKTNALGFATYAGLAVLSSIGIFLGVKAKDAITDKSIQKKMNKMGANAALNKNLACKTTQN